MQIDRKIAAIIRWLERLKKSYSSGSLETALMDAECARADIDDLTREVWSRVSPHPRSPKPIILKAAGALALSVSIISVWVSPLSRERVLLSPQQAPALTVATASEPEAAPSPAPVPAPEPKRTIRRRLPAHSPKPQPQPQKQAATFTAPSKPHRTVAEDQIYSLVQTGRRALKNDKTVIKIH